MNVQRSHFRTHDLAQAADISVQQVRNYEANGFIPAATRAPNGYRQYEARHLVALTTLRLLISGYGWQQAGAIMQAVHHQKLPQALALIDAHHAALTSQRIQLEQTLAALNTLVLPNTLGGTVRRPTRLRVGEAATQVGVRVSAIHFWETQGLLQPGREPENRYRLYDEKQMRRLRVVVLLRGAGYDFDAIRLALEELEAGKAEKAMAAVEQRHGEVALASWRCLGALTAFYGYIREFWSSLADMPGDNRVTVFPTMA